MCVFGTQEKISDSETGSGGPYPNITAIIMACHFVTVKGMSTLKSLFDIFDIRKRKLESDADLWDDTLVKKPNFFP